MPGIVCTPPSAVWFCALYWNLSRQTSCGFRLLICFNTLLLFIDKRMIKRLSQAVSTALVWICYVELSTSDPSQRNPCSDSKLVPTTVPTAYSYTSCLWDALALRLEGQPVWQATKLSPSTVLAWIKLTLYLCSATMRLRAAVTHTPR